MTISMLSLTTPGPRGSRPTQVCVAVLFAAALCGLALSLTGCTGQERGKEKLLILRTPPLPNSKAFRKLLDRFENQNPRIRVTHETATGSSDSQRQTYIIDLQAGATTPDVFAMDPTWGPEFAASEWVKSLDSLTGGKAGLEDFFAASVHAATWQGKVIAIPWHMGCGVLYYRKDLLEKYHLAPPETYEDLAQVVQTIRQGEGETAPGGFIYPAKPGEALVCCALEFLWGNGADVFGYDGSVQIASPDAVEAITVMRDLMDRGVTPTYVTNLDEDAARDAFASGRAIFLRGSIRDWDAFQQPACPVQGLVACKGIPHFSGHSSAGALGGLSLAVNRNSRHHTEAWKLIEFLTSAEVQKQIAIEMGFAPTRRSIYGDPQFRAARPFLSSLEAILGKARVRPTTPAYPTISQVLQSELSAALTGSQPPAEAMKEAGERLRR